jgi:DMSO/TMAO reductase YedYZ molybdopterin-dependent catalytic subunit
MNFLHVSRRSFVRYHLSNIPLSIDPDAFRLDVKGLVNSPLKLSLAELKKDFENVEVFAVNQCSGYWVKHLNELKCSPIRSAWLHSVLVTDIR